MTVKDATPTQNVLRDEVTQFFRRKRIVSFAFPAVILAYFAYISSHLTCPG
jgi:hypothetical protein